MWCEELIKGKCSSVPGVHPHNHVGSSVQHNPCSHTHINSSLLETNVMYHTIKGKAKQEPTVVITTLILLALVLLYLNGH